MPTLTIAAAQSISIAGDLQANIARHRHFIEIAAGPGVGDVLVVARRDADGWTGQVVAVADV